MTTSISPHPRRLGGVLTLILTLLLTLTSAPLLVPAAASPFPDGYPKMGSRAESQAGHRIATGDGAIRTRLFPLYTRPGDEPDQLSYCVEFSVNARYDLGMSVGGWDSFPGDNNFASDAQVREHVAWIVRHSYPQTRLDTLAEAAEADGLTAQDAIAATQAAIWTYTDAKPAKAGFVYKGLATGRGTDTTSPEARRVQAVIDYLTGDANTGKPESEGPQLTTAGLGTPGTAGEKVGPVTFNASEAELAVTVETDYPLVFADGAPVDPQRVPSGRELFLDVPADAPAGSATLSATVTGPRWTGMLVSNTTPRAQTLMISRSEEAQASAEVTLTWKAVPRIGTTARDGDDGDDFLPDSGPATVIDTVEYAGLVPGAEYELRGELMLRGEEGPEPTGITSTLTFVPEEPDGTVELRFEVPADHLHGQTVVVYERLYRDGKEVAAHTDIDDEAQTVYRPFIESDAYDLADGDQTLPAAGGTLRDEIAYAGLRTGQWYAARGEVMDRKTGESTGITGETEFLADSATGTVVVDFDIPGEYAGKTLVVFQRLYSTTGPVLTAYSTSQGTTATSTPASSTPAPSAPTPSTPPGEDDEVLLAVHEDLNEERQTVVVEEEPPAPPEQTTPPEQATTPPEEITPPEETAPPEQPTTSPAEGPDEPSPSTPAPVTEGPREELPRTGSPSLLVPLGVAVALLGLGGMLLGAGVRWRGR